MTCSPGKKTPAAATLSILLLLPLMSKADDTEVVYESLPEVTIGKVFFSVAERERLDRRRGLKAADTQKSTVTRRQEKAANKGAGYIITHGGASRVYANGEFVATGESDSVSFPGAVKVVRSEAAPQNRIAQATDGTDSGKSKRDDNSAK